jgi:hypothetical protein
LIKQNTPIKAHTIKYPKNKSHACVPLQYIMDFPILMPHFLDLTSVEVKKTPTGTIEINRTFNLNPLGTGGYRE